MKKKRAIGRREVVDFPELQLVGIDAKIDTGAYTSSIHCNNIRLINRHGKKVLFFKLLDTTHPEYKEKEFFIAGYQIKTIKNSFGQREKRFIIKSKMRLFDILYNIELSLTDRAEMKYQVLIGRKALKGRFIVDVARYNLSKKNK